MADTVNLLCAKQLVKAHDIVRYNLAKNKKLDKLLHINGFKQFLNFHELVCKMSSDLRKEINYDTAHHINPNLITNFAHHANPKVKLAWIAYEFNIPNLRILTNVCMPVKVDKNDHPVPSLTYYGLENQAKDNPLSIVDIYHKTSYLQTLNRKKLNELYLHNVFLYSYVGTLETSMNHFKI